ncbi:MAG: ABC transporter ATP-binding protein [Hyphomicrobiales bacterium]|nr:ABC transporter ATP-binding protein [Hyphomicrobiales bacterium]
MTPDSLTEPTAAGQPMPRRPPGVPVEIAAVSQVFRRAQLETQALERIDLAVKPGEFVAVVGPSGCGKSTLLKIIAGLLAPSTGKVEIAGRLVSGPYTDLGIVFQSPVLLDWRTILDNVLVQIDLRGGNLAAYRDQARALLAKVGLAGFENQMPRELSGGMRQRTAIVRALIHEPPLLMMDEPFGALDALTREQMRIDLEKLWLERGQTTFFITHGISEAVALADRVIVMTPRPGRIERIIEIDLPRPRHKAVITSRRFTDYCEDITECFMRHGVIQY